MWNMSSTSVYSTYVSFNNKICSTSVYYPYVSFNNKTCSTWVYSPYVSFNNKTCSTSVYSPIFSAVDVAQSLVFCAVFCGSLIVLWGVNSCGTCLVVKRYVICLPICLYCCIFCNLGRSFTRKIFSGFLRLSNYRYAYLAQVDTLLY
jgi:hypothetical protein